MKRITVCLFLVSLIILSSCAKPNNNHSSSESGENTVTSASSDAPNTDSPTDNTGIEVYENVSEHISESFLDTNRTYMAFYNNVSLLDPSYPKERVFIIKSQNDFDRIFMSEIIDDTPIDYQTEMYVLYTFTTVYFYEFVIESASVVDQELTVHFRLKSPNDPDENGHIPPEPIIGSARPFQRFVLIKMSKADVNSARFTEVE